MASVELAGKMAAAAVVYDLDGTLLDTENLAWDAINAVVQQFGVEGGITWDTRVKLLGLPGPTWAEIVLDESGLQGRLSPTELLADWHAHLEQLIAQLSSRLPGVDQLVGVLERAGVRQAIATSSTADAVRAKRANHESVFDAMDAIVSGDEVPAGRGKPQPDIYLMAAERLGVRPEDCFAFEDSLSGVRAARAAGMTVIAVPDSRLDVALFEEAAHQVLPSMAAFDPLQSRTVGSGAHLKLAGFAPRGRQCPSGHEMVPNAAVPGKSFPVVRQYGECDLCDTRGTTYRCCAGCDYDLCNVCYAAGRL